MWGPEGRSGPSEGTTKCWGQEGEAYFLSFFIEL